MADRTMAVLRHNVNVMDSDGVILASGDGDRIGGVHEGALLAAQQQRVVEIGSEETGALRGVQPGVNVPIRSRGELIGVIGITGDPAEVRVLGDLIRVTAELMVDQAHAAEQQHWRRHEREEFVAQAATGAVERRDLAPWAASLGIDLDVARLPVVVVPTGTGEGMGGLGELHRSLAGIRGVLVGRTSPRELVLFSTAHRAERLPIAVSEQLSDRRETIRYAVGRAFSGELAFERGYLTALDVLAVGRLIREDTSAYTFDDLPLLALLSGLRQDWRAELVAEPWHRLEASDPTGELRATFQAYVRHRASPTATANALHVHRNTVRYRLGRIGEITGLQLDRLPHVMWLYLGPVVATGGAVGG